MYAVQRNRHRIAEKREEGGLHLQKGVGCPRPAIITGGLDPTLFGGLTHDYALFVLILYRVIIRDSVTGSHIYTGRGRDLT